MIDDIKNIFKATGLAFFMGGFVILLVSLFIAAFSSVFEPSPEQKAAMRVPQLMSEADGCKVYRFVDSGTHYFTRCPATTTTDRNYSERHGKVTVQKTEQIITENK